MKEEWSQGNGMLYKKLLGATLVAVGALLMVTLAACGGSSTASYTVGGTVKGLPYAGLTGNALVLQNNGANDLSISANGVFTFTAAIASGSTYSVAIKTAPTSPALTCAITAGSGTISGANVSNVVVDCTTPAHFAYVANNSASGGISSYTVNSATGLLTAGTTTPTAANPTSVAVDPNGKFAYVTMLGGTTSTYSISQTSGLLTFANSITSVNPYAVKIHPNGLYAYVADGTSNNVVAYTITPATGALTLLGTSPTGKTTASSLTLDPLGKFAYVLNGGSGNVSVFSINQTTGTLGVAAQTAPVGGIPQQLAIDPSGKFAYVVDSNFVYAYTIDPAAGVLTQIGTTGVSAGTNPVSVAVSPNGKFAYVADGSFSGTVYVFSISTTGALTQVGSPVAAGTIPSRVDIDPSGLFAYVTNKSGNNVSMYTIDQTAGTLSGGTTISAGTNPSGITTTR